MLGAGGDRGMALAQFAVPEARGPVEGDANVYQDDCASSQLPCPADEQRTPACEVTGPDVDDGDVIRVCDLFDKPLVISFWFTRGGDCLPTQDVVDDVASEYRGRVNFLSVDVRDDRDDVRRVIEERGWRDPGRTRRRRRGQQHLPRRRLPDGRVRLPRRHPAVGAPSAARSSREAA